MYKKVLNLRNKWQFKEEALLKLEGGYVDHQLHCPTVQVMMRMSLKFTWGNQALKSGEQRLHILHSILRASKHPQNSLSDFFSLLFESVFWKQLNASCTESKSLIWLWIFMVLSLVLGTGSLASSGVLGMWISTSMLFVWAPDHGSAATWRLLNTAYKLECLA